MRCHVFSDVNISVRVHAHCILRNALAAWQAGGLVCAPLLAIVCMVQLKELAMSEGLEELMTSRHFRFPLIRGIQKELGKTQVELENVQLLLQTSRVLELVETGVLELVETK